MTFCQIFNGLMLNLPTSSVLKDLDISPSIERIKIYIGSFFYSTTNKSRMTVNGKKPVINGFLLKVEQQHSIFSLRFNFRHPLVANK